MIIKSKEQLLGHGVTSENARKFLEVCEYYGVEDRYFWSVLNYNKKVSTVCNGRASYNGFCNTDEIRPYMKLTELSNHDLDETLE